jgi:hypothetical protein
MAGVLPWTGEALHSADLATRNATAHGRGSGAEPTGIPPGVLPPLATVLVVATGSLALAAWRRATAAGLAVALGATAAFLLVSGRGLEGFARSRAAAPLERVLHERLAPDDLVVHEGPLENSASLLLGLRRAVPLVDGLQSNLAFGATFADARPLVWDRGQLAEVWRTRRVFLISVVAPEGSVAGELEPVILLGTASGRRLYTNFAHR